MFLLGGFLCLSMGFPSAATAQEQSEDVKLAVSRAVAYLLSNQNKEGAITDRNNPVALSALSIMAMASVGLLPSDPTPQGKAINQALEYVLLDQHQREDGYFGASDGSRMYGHGIITLMLTELDGMGRNEEQNKTVHLRCRNAISLILASQRINKSFELSGGWRYEPNSSDSDLSVSVWQLLALRSAANDEFDVPPAAIAQAVNYLERSFTGRLDEMGNPEQETGGFGYMPGYGNPSFAMTAAGTLALQACGQYDSPLVNAAVNWLKKNPPQSNDRFFYYGIYYYSQAMHQRGDEAAYDVVKNSLLPLQQADGRWDASRSEEGNAGDVYATAMAILSLSVRYHYLPIYQR